MTDEQVKSKVQDAFNKLLIELKEGDSELASNIKEAVEEVLDSMTCGEFDKDY